MEKSDSVILLYLFDCFLPIGNRFFLLSYYLAPSHIATPTMPPIIHRDELHDVVVLA